MVLHTTKCPFDISQIPLYFSKYAKDTQKLNENETNDGSATKH